MSTFAPLKFQLRSLVGSKRLRYATLVCLVGIMAVHLQGITRFWLSDQDELPTAAVGWMANYQSMRTDLWIFLILFIVPVLACILHGDVLFDDIKRNRLSSIVSRSSRSAYILSSALLVFFSAFFFVLIFQAVSQLTALLVFPVQADSDVFQIGFLSSAAELKSRLSYVSNPPFGYLASMNPYLLNLAYMLYDAYYIASLTLFSFTVSLYVRKSRFLILVLPAILILNVSRIVPSNVNPALNMLLSISRGECLSLFSMLAAPTGCLVVCMAAIVLHEKVLKKDLL